MRLKLTLFLVLLNVALFSYIVYLETREDRENSEARGHLILPAGTISQAEELALSGEHVESPWTIRRQDDEWHAVQPVEWLANPYAVRRLLDLLSFLQWETRFPVDSIDDAGKELADYGLGEGAAELRITSNNETVTLRVGKPTEIGNRVYILSPDRREVFVVKRDLLSGVNLAAESLINHTVIEIPTFEVESINLSIGAGNAVRVQLSRANREWVFNAPIRAAADSHKVNSALDALHQLEVVRFTDLSPAATGISEPALRLNLNGNNRQQTLLLGAVVDPNAFPVERYAKLEARAVVFTVPAEPFEVWFKAQESLRERHFMDFSPEHAGTLEVGFDNRAITLQKLESGRWQLVQATDGNLTTRPADDKLIQVLLQHLAALEAIRFVTDAPSSSDLDRYGFNDPQRRITVRLGDGNRRTLLVGNFAFGNPDESRPNRVYAKLEEDSSVYLTSASILADLPLNGLYYRERVAGSLPAGAALHAVRIIDLESGQALLDVRKPPQADWEQALADLSEPLQAAAQALLRAFRHFPVAQFLADSFSAPLELDAERTIPWEFALEADVQLPGGETSNPETRRYLLTERLGGSTQYAGSETLDLTFRLTQDLIDVLQPILFDRPPPTAEAYLNPPEPPATEPANTAPAPATSTDH